MIYKNSKISTRNFSIAFDLQNLFDLADIFKFDVTEYLVIVMSLIQCSDEVQHPFSLHPLSIIRISISIT